MAAKKRGKKPAKASEGANPPLEPARHDSVLEPSEHSPPTPTDEDAWASNAGQLEVPVAGLVASAGGFDAFKRFFTVMTADSGIAFVLVPHLDHTHASLMVEPLTRHTTMPVVEAANGMAVEANHVYIIPPNKNMTIEGGMLRLTGPVERGGWQTSIEERLRQMTGQAQEGEARLEAILNSAADAIITIDAQGTIQSANPVTERMFGYAAPEMIGQNIAMLMPAPYRAEHDRYLARYQQTRKKHIIGSSREVAGQRKDGSTFPVDLAVSEVDHLNLFTGIIRDITQRKQVETALRESEQFSRATIDALSAHVAIIAGEGTILAVNRAWREFASANGATPGSMEEGVNYLGVCERSVGPDSEEGPQVAAGIRAVLAGQMAEFAIEYPCHAPPEERWFALRVTPLPGDGPRRVVVAHENITQRRILEREIVAVASQEQQRIGQDLHDSVSQELTALSMLAGDLAETLQSDPSNGPHLVERLVLGLRRSQQELRAVMRGLCPVSVDAEGLMAALSDLTSLIQQESKVTCVFDCPDLVLVEDNLIATHLYLIAQEAIYNAVKHAQCQNIRVSVKSDHYLVMRVQDDGIGIPDRSTERHGGLGLRIMRNRAAIIHAMITIEQAKPAGTVITCALGRKNYGP